MFTKAATLPLLLIVASLLAMGCCCKRPDLIVELPDEPLNWSIGDAEATTTAAFKFRVRNIGNATAGQFLVYVDAELEPPNREILIQRSFTVDGLGPAGAPNEFIDLAGSFVPDPKWSRLTAVQQVRIIADAKNMVAESNETNNAAVVPVP